MNNLKIQRKEWQNPMLEVLNIDKTMASSAFGAYDEGYNSTVSEEEQTTIHHGS